jgi:hypothetical protein
MKVILDQNNTEIVNPRLSKQKREIKQIKNLEIERLDHRKLYRI